jgi:hypothetical protein
VLGSSTDVETVASATTSGELVGVASVFDTAASEVAIPAGGDSCTVRLAVREATSGVASAVGATASNNFTKT